MCAKDQYNVMSDKDLLEINSLSEVHFRECFQNERMTGTIIIKICIHSIFFIQRSSEWPYQRTHALHKAMIDIGIEIPKDRWFTNLSTKGNTGAASIFISLDEAFNNGLFKEGERILLMVPESGRFMSCYIHLTCVSH